MRVCLCVSYRDKRELAKSKVRDARQVLELWKSSYFDVRAEIQKGGTGKRWEFDRRKLFEKTDYMASICQDLSNVLHVSVFYPFTLISTCCMGSYHINKLGVDVDLFCFLQNLEEFYNIFCPELKSVTWDPKRFDEMQAKVDNLILPFEEANFDPFSSCKISSWKIIMQNFNSTVNVSSGCILT